MKQKTTSPAGAFVKLLGASIGLSLLSSAASAQTTIFSDNFDDGNRDGWYVYGDRAGTYTVDASNNRLETVSGAYAIWGAVSNFSGVTLATTGDFIKLELDYTVIDPIDARNMTFGLYNSHGTTISADQQTDNQLTDEKGYHSYTQSDENRLVHNLDQGLATVNGNSNIKVSYGGNDNPFALAGSYTYTLLLEVNGSGAIAATQIFNEGQANELSMGAAVFGNDIFTFDTVAIQGIDKDFWVDNIVITSNVPEPSSYALLAGVFGLTSVLIRRRR